MRRLALLPLLAIALAACDGADSDPDPDAATYLRLDRRVLEGDARWDVGEGAGPARTYVQVLTSEASLGLDVPGLAPTGGFVVGTDVMSQRAAIHLLLNDGVTGYTAVGGGVVVESRVESRLVGRFNAVLRGRDGKTVTVEGRFDAPNAPLVIVEG